MVFIKQRKNNEAKIAAKLQQNGWDKAALQVYDKAYAKRIAKGKPMEAWTETSRLIGSELYTKMFKAARLSPQQKLTLVLQQLQAQVDRNGFLQVGTIYSLDPQMAPHAAFLQYFRKLVQQVFRKRSLREYANGADGLAELAQKLHLFRSYLDRNNIRFVRTNFVGQNDFEKLLQYAQYYQFKLDYGTDANYHNRHLKSSAFLYPQNMKIQVTKSSRMSEFIVALRTGQFVTEWQVYKYTAAGQIDSNPGHYAAHQAEAIANTESFNYGIPKGRSFNPLLCINHSHQLLDVRHPADPKLRRVLTTAGQDNYWLAEKDYYVKNAQGEYVGQYADLVKKGQEDVVAWRQVPDAKKAQVYADFLKYCRQRWPLRNPGFAKYFRSKMRK